MEHPKRRPQNAENVKNKTMRKTPQHPKPRKTENYLERGGDAKISDPWLRLEIHLRYVGPPAQTR